MAKDRLADHWLWSTVEARIPVVPLAQPEVVPEPPAAAEPVHEAAPIDETQHELVVSTEIPKEQAEACPTLSTFDEAAALHKLGRWEEALALYTRIPESDERYTDALLNMIAIAAARNDFSTLREYGEELLRLRRQSRPALEALMQSGMATGDYRAAAQYGTRLVKQAADSHQAWFNLGLCYHKTSHFQQAAQAYTEAINLCPDGIRARANLGVLLQAHGDVSGARREFEQVLEVEPNDLPTLWNLALIHEKEGHIAKAEKVYLRLIREEYQVYAVAFRLGRLRLNRKNYLGATEAFERCLLERAGDATAEINLILAKREAKQPMPELPGTHSDSLEGRVLRATFAVEMNDWKTASELELKLSEMGENTAILTYNIGVLQQRENLLPEAILSYQKASRQRPGFAEAHLNCGHAMMQMGQTDQARAAWKEALEAKPEIAVDYFKAAAVSGVRAWGGV
ncbi:MAG: tetratricopeptide repeat protein [Acidobacteriota bacterium]|nr:tetratricopeptide repeat protein [Acidobacteriota bacterium]